MKTSVRVILHSNGSILHHDVKNASEYVVTKSGMLIVYRDSNQSYEVALFAAGQWVGVEIITIEEEK